MYAIPSPESPEFNRNSTEFQLSSFDSSLTRFFSDQILLLSGQSENRQTTSSTVINHVIVLNKPVNTEIS